MTRQFNALSAGSRLAPVAAPASLPAMPQQPVEQWGAPPPPPSAPAPAYQRYLARHRPLQWLILAMTLLGLLGGYVATRYIKPEYDVQGKITLRDPSAEIIGNSRQRSNESYLQLFRAFTVTDSVTKKLRLYLEPSRDADSVISASSSSGRSSSPAPTS